MSLSTPASLDRNSAPDDFSLDSFNSFHWFCRYFQYFFNITKYHYVVFCAIHFYCWSDTYIRVLFCGKVKIPLSTPASLYWNVAPDDFSQYNSIFTSINVPSSSPNSGPANVQIFSLKVILDMSYIYLRTIY